MGQLLTPQNAAELLASQRIYAPVGLRMEFSSDVSPLINVWKKHRSAIHQGYILLIGQAPDGKIWTGLCSIAGDRKYGYCVIFCRSVWRYHVWWEALPLFYYADDERLVDSPIKVHRRGGIAE